MPPPAEGARPRVLMIAPHFAEYTLYLARALAAHAEVEVGFDAGNLAAETRGFRIEDARALGFGAFTFQTRSAVHRWLATARILWRSLKRRPDVIHFQESGNALTLVAAPLARLIAPVVLTVHDPLPHMGRDASALKRWRRRVQVRRAAALCLVHGEHCQAELRSEAAGAIGHVATTRHGVILVPEPADRRDPQPDALLFFGRMEAYKGLGVLLDACERLWAQGATFTLSLAGRGPELDQLRSRIDALPAITVMDGWLTPQEAVQAFQTAGVVVLPYLEATQSGVLAAAFANGRPVVASDVGGIPDVVEHGRTGLLVPPGDPAALAEAIRTLLQDPAARSAMGAAAARAAQTDLDWDAIAAEMAASYRTLARPGGRP
jgi:glycosyltransferase involved in cell wall biosynthesis